MTGPKTHGTPLATTFRTEIKPARFVFPRLQIVRCGVDVKTPGPSRQSNALVSGGAGSNVGTGSGDKTSTMTYVQLKRCPFRTPDGGAGPNLSRLTAVQLRVLADPTTTNPPSPPHFSTLLHPPPLLPPKGRGVPRRFAAKPFLNHFNLCGYTIKIIPTPCFVAIRPEPDTHATFTDIPPRRHPEFIHMIQPCHVQASQ